MHAFDVLGDPVRRRILELLADGERAAGASVTSSRTSSASPSPRCRSTCACCGRAGSRTSGPRARAGCTRCRPPPCRRWTCGSSATARSGASTSTRWRPRSPEGKASERPRRTRRKEDDDRPDRRAQRRPPRDRRTGRSPRATDAPSSCAAPTTRRSTTSGTRSRRANGSNGGSCRSPAISQPRWDAISSKATRAGRSSLRSAEVI